MSSLLKEILVTYYLLKSNFSADIGFFFIAVHSRYVWDFPGWEAFLAVQMKMLFLSSLHLYAFDIVNQVKGVQEDVVNRPDRPIPSGLITLQGGYVRWVIIWILAPVIGYTLGSRHVAEYFLWWQMWVYFCYVWPGFNDPFMKSAFSGVGVYNMMRLLNAVAQSCGDSFDMPKSPDLVMGIWVLVTIQLQEFHDQNGDSRHGRATIATYFGSNTEPLIRRINCGVCFLSGVLFFGACGLTDSVAMHGLGLFNLLLSGVTGLRCLGNKGQTHDEKTYKLYYILLTYEVYMILSYFGRHGCEHCLQLHPFI